MSFCRRRQLPRGRRSCTSRRRRSRRFGSERRNRLRHRRSTSTKESTMFAVALLRGSVPMSTAPLPSQSSDFPAWYGEVSAPRRPRRELVRSRRDGDQAVRLRDLGGDPARARRPDQGDRPRELLLPSAHARLGAGAGGRARRRVRARGRRRHRGGREAAGGAARGASHLGGADLVDVCPLGAVVPRSAAALQPVGERRPLGAAAAPVPADERVPLAGRAHGARDRGRRRLRRR